MITAQTSPRSLRRLWELLHRDAPEALPVLDPPAPVLTFEQTRTLRDLFSDEIFLGAQEEYGRETALDRLSPNPDRRRRPGRFARSVRRTAGDLREVAVAVVTAVVTVAAAVVLIPMLLLALGPFLYELGV